MNALKLKIVSFLRKEDGPTAVEYAVMLALIIIVAIIAISLLGNNASVPAKNSAAPTLPAPAQQQTPAPAPAPGPQKPTAQ